MLLAFVEKVICVAQMDWTLLTSEIIVLGELCDQVGGTLGCGAENVVLLQHHQLQDQPFPFLLQNMVNSIVVVQMEVR